MKKTNKKTPAKKTTPKANPKKSQKGKHRPHYGNQFWKARSSHGRRPIFSTPDQLWASCCEYFEWVDQHPLSAAELVKYRGTATVKRVPKMRAMTIASLCIFLDIDTTTWFDYAKNKTPDFSPVCTRVENIIREQKFGGAAAELLNPSIIARDLGLVEKRELTGRDGGPLFKSADIPAEIREKLAGIADEMVKAAKKGGE